MALGRCLTQSSNEIFKIEISIRILDALVWKLYGGFPVVDKRFTRYNVRPSARHPWHVLHKPHINDTINSFCSAFYVQMSRPINWNDLTNHVHCFTWSPPKWYLSELRRCLFLLRLSYYSLRWIMFSAIKIERFLFYLLVIFTIDGLPQEFVNCDEYSRFEPIKLHFKPKPLDCL